MTFPYNLKAFDNTFKLITKMYGMRVNADCWKDYAIWHNLTVEERFHHRNEFWIDEEMGKKFDELYPIQLALCRLQ